MGDKMKKIVSMLMVFVAVMAFSGLTMATPVSAYSIKDKGGNTNIVTGTYPQNQVSFYQKFTYNWHLIYYNSKHCTFCMTERIYVSDTTQYESTIIEYLKVDYKRVNKNHIRYTTTNYLDGIKYSSVTHTVKTSLSPYKYFKTQKNKIIKKEDPFLSA